MNKGSSVCRAISVRADYAEQEIMSRLQKILSHPQLVDDVYKSMKQKQDVDKELVDIDRKKDKYFKLFEDDVLTSQSLKEKLADIDKSKHQLQMRKVAIESQLTDNTIDQTVSEAVVRGILGELVALFNKLSNENLCML